jgi:hypothetical protein
MNSIQNYEFIYEFTFHMVFIHEFKIGMRYRHMNSSTYEFKKYEFMVS